MISFFKVGHVVSLERIQICLLFRNGEEQEKQKEGLLNILLKKGCAFYLSIVFLSNFTV